MLYTLNSTGYQLYLNKIGRKKSNKETLSQTLKLTAGHIC